jgi:hypothetical protein
LKQNFRTSTVPRLTHDLSSAMDEDLSELLSDVLPDFADIHAALAKTRGVDPEVALLISSALERPNQPSPKDVQRLLHQQVALVDARVLTAEAVVVVKTDGNSGMHFLMHASKATETPLINLCGPCSGTLCPGDEAAHPGKALLKTIGSKNSKGQSSHPCITVLCCYDAHLLVSRFFSGCISC